MTRQHTVLAPAPGTSAAAAPIAARLAALPWEIVERDLSATGYAVTAPVLSPAECDALVALYDDEERFRSRIVMARHRFGEGEYKYFRRPLPGIVADLREHAYPPLAAVADRWAAALGTEDRFPRTHAEFLAHCAARGQTKPTPLMLRYGPGGYNCLHQDLYGDVAFPFQLLVLLRQPGRDYTGGEFLLVEQRPRAQSAAEVVAAEQGALIFFTTRQRPVQGSRGYYRVNVRHGVSRVHSGERYTLGVVFHDAS
jgi:hypothetical protein